jgi:hypothetical protein
MDADETLARLFRQRRYLIVFAAVLAAGAFILVRQNTHASYRADARLVLGSELSSSQEAQTVVARASAIATSDAVLTVALKNAHSLRTVDQLRGEVGLSGLNDSGLARLSVTDADPAIAAALCRSLAAATVNFINTTNSAPTTSTLTSIDSQLQAAIDQYDAIESGSSTAGSIADQARLAAISENITALSTARGQLLARRAQQVPAAVVDQPPALGTRTKSEVATTAGLCVVGGILVWLIAAAVLESFRPTLPTLRAVGRYFDAPVLGTLQVDLDLADAETTEAIDRLILSAQHLRAETIVVGGRADLSPSFVTRLDALLSAKALVTSDHSYGRDLALPSTVGIRGAVALGTAIEQASLPAARNGKSTKIYHVLRHAVSFDLAHLAPSGGTGVLVVTKPGSKRAQLHEVDEMVRCSYWPVVGVIQVIDKVKRSTAVDRDLVGGST